MKHNRDRYLRDYELNHQGEPGLRELAEMFAKRAEEHEQEAAISQVNARRCLEAADARAREKAARRDARRAERQALRKGPKAP